MRARIFGKTAKQHLADIDPLALEPTISQIATGKIPLRILPSGLKIWGYTKAGHQICGSRRMNMPGHYCKRKDVLHPSGRCARHGGMSLSGVNHGRYKHGRYLGLPGSSKQIMEESLNDPNQTSMRPDIAATDSRIAEIAELQGGIDTDVLKKLLASGEELKFMLSEEELDTVDLVNTIHAHLDLLFGLYARERNWSLLLQMQKHRALLAKVEDDRQHHEQTQIPVEKVHALFQRFGEICRDHLLSEHPIPLAAIERELNPVLLDFFPRHINTGHHKSEVAEHPADDSETVIEAEVVTETAIVPVASQS